MEKTMDFECEGEPKTWPWFQNKGNTELKVENVNFYEHTHVVKYLPLNSSKFYYCYQTVYK